MEGINKLRTMTEWFNNQSEFLTDGLSLKQLEKLYDYAIKNDLPFMDNDFLFSADILEEDRKKALKFLKKLKANK